MNRPARLATWIGVVGIALSMVACSVPLPELPAEPSLDTPGAVPPPQADRIARHTFADITAADEAKEAGWLGERVGTEAGRIRAVEYVVANKGGAAPDAIVAEVQAFYSTNSTQWPRPLVGVTDPEGVNDLPVVLLWVQDGPSEPYTLRAWASMLPQAVLPAMPPLSEGAPLLSLDATGFTETPREAVERYVALLNQGGEGDLNSTFLPDAYRSAMFEARTALSKTAKGRSGTYTDTVMARLDQAVVLGDAQGGALVLVRLEVVSDFNVPGAQLTLLTAADKALLEGTLKSRVVYRYEDLVVIRLWAEGVSAIPSVVAAGQHLVGVSTS